MTEERPPQASHAPFSIIAISALLWSQGGIWGALGAVSLRLSGRLPAGDVITAVLFGFTGLWWVLAVLLPWRGGERARTVIIAQQTLIAFLGVAILGTWVFAIRGYYLMAPVGLFIITGIFMAACAAAALLRGSAHDFCSQRAAL